MTTYYPNNTTTSTSTTNNDTGQGAQPLVPTDTVPVLLEDKDQQPSPNTNDPFDMNHHFPWLNTPLSPPLGKKEKPFPVNTKRASVSGWHSLWSSSTWQNTTEEPMFSQKRSRSESMMQPSPLPAPLTSSTSCSLFDHTAVDDYFQNNKSSFPSPITYQGSNATTSNSNDKSIWSFDYPSIMNNR
jgi:hypothetical protein